MRDSVRVLAFAGGLWIRGGKVSEFSRGELWTAVSDNRILDAVTRKVRLELCRVSSD